MHFALEGLFSASHVSAILSGTWRWYNPFRVGDCRGTANPGCAARPWATVWNAFGVEEPASVSEIPTYVEPLMTAVRERPIVRPSTSPPGRRRGDAEKGRHGERGAGPRQ